MFSIVEIENAKGVRTAMAGDCRACIGLVNVSEAFFLKSLFDPSNDLVVFVSIDCVGDEDDFFVWVIEGLEGLFNVIWAPLLDWAAEFLAAFHLAGVGLHQNLWAEMEEVGAESCHRGTSSSFIEEVDGLEAEGSLVAWNTFLDELDDLFWGFAGFDKARGIDGFKGDAGRKGTAVDDVDFAAEGIGSVEGVVIGARDARAKADMDLNVVVFEDRGEEFGVFHLVDGAQIGRAHV